MVIRVTSDGYAPTYTFVDETVQYNYEVFKIHARNLDEIIVGTITRDSNGAPTSAPVVWPNGIQGVYTALVISTAFPSAVDSYQVTYLSSTPKTFTQPLVTRDANGAIINVPAIVVS